MSSAKDLIPGIKNDNDVSVTESMVEGIARTMSCANYDSTYRVVHVFHKIACDKFQCNRLSKNLGFHYKVLRIVCRKFVLSTTVFCQRGKYSTHLSVSILRQSNGQIEHPNRKSAATTTQHSPLFRERTSTYINHQ